MWVLWIQSLITLFCVSMGAVCRPSDLGHPTWHHGEPYAFVERYATEAECEVVRSVKELSQRPTFGLTENGTVMIEHSWALWCAPAEE